MTSYALNPAWEHEKERLDVQSSLNDPGTRARIEALGIKEGWHCAEIGAGTGTVAAWLCERVGPDGRVVATDVDTRFLELLDLPNLEVRKHDITKDHLEPGDYDLIHLRLLLVHLRDSAPAALARMVDALRPGGWLLAEENDGEVAQFAYPPDETLERIQSAMAQVGAALNITRQTGRRVPSMLEQAGLVDVAADARSTLLRQGSAGMKALTLFQTFQRDRVLATGAVTEEEYDAMIERYTTPGPRWRMSPTIIAAWGRKPSG